MVTETMARSNAATDDMEPALAKILARRKRTRELPPYSARSTDFVTNRLTSFLTNERPGSIVSDIRRMGGGASKEQFLFTLTEADGSARKYVLRMDPRGAITETDRGREYELLNLVQGLIPAPKPVWLDPDGSHFEQPAVIMEFVGGVTKPSDTGLKVSGLGTALGSRLRDQLKGQFVEHLVTLHAIDWRSADLPSYTGPTDDPEQAARWSFNYWKAMWDLDKTEERPIMSLATQWLADNMPACDPADLVLTHGDYRTGNYLFDETTGQITAVLDWELARVGDFHEDLAWTLTELFGTVSDGVFRAGDLFTRDEQVSEYERGSGRTVNRTTLHYYDVMAAWKCYIIVAANGLAAARAQHNHQDVLLTFLGSAAPLFAGDLCRLLSQEVTA